jgi:hypothetical protein
MKYLCVLIVMTAMVFVAAGSTRGSTNPGPLMLGSRAVAAVAPSSLPAVKGDESLSKTIFPAALKSTVAQFSVAASAEDGKGDDEKEKNPPPRSKRCPPDKDDKDKGSKGGDDKDKNNKDNDHHDDCGKGDDGKNP